MFSYEMAFGYHFGYRSDMDHQTIHFDAPFDHEA